MSKLIEDKPIAADLKEVNKTSQGSLVANLGIEYTYVGTARVEGTMPVDHRTCQPFGVLHGGASLAFAETLSGLGSIAIIGKDEMAVGQQVSGNHISSAPVGSTVKGVATLLHKGRSSHVWNVDILALEDEKLISTVRVIYFIKKK